MDYLKIFLFWINSQKYFVWSKVASVHISIKNKDRIVLLVRELFIYVFNMYLFDERNLFILPWWPINLYLTVLDKDGQMILLDLILP